jgi:hypothetical protein
VCSALASAARLREVSNPGGEKRREEKNRSN